MMRRAAARMVDGWPCAERSCRRPTYGQSVGWQPARPRLSVRPAGGPLDRGRPVGVRRRRPGARLRPGGLWRRLRGRRDHRGLQRRAAADRGGAAMPWTLVHRLPARAARRRGRAGARRRPRAGVRAGRLVRDRAARRAGDVGGRRWCSRCILGTNDDDRTRCASCAAWRARQGDAAPTDAPGSSSSRSTGWRCRCCGARCATATRRRWPAGWRRTATGWPNGRRTSRPRPGASQAGILLGSNEDIPAFRWVEKETGTMMVCSSPGALRRDRAPPLDRDRPARRRRRQPRQPALGRRRGDDPDGQPHGGGEGSEPRATGPSSRTA